MRILGLRSWFITFLTEAYLVLGRIAEALEQAEQTVALARAQKQRGWEAWALKVLGDIHAHEPGEVEQAADAYRRALALATDLGMRPLVAHCNLALARVHPETDRRNEVSERLAIASALYREMEMRFWLEKAESAPRAV